MQSCTCVFGYTVWIASGKPFSPSTQAIRMSRTPRLRISVRICSQNLAPSVALVHKPSTSFCPPRSTPMATNTARFSTRPSCRILTTNASRYTMAYTGSKGRLCQTRTSSITASVTSLINEGLTSTTIDFFQVALDLARRQAPSVQGQDLVIKTGKPALMLGQDLRLEAAVAIAWNGDLD